MSYNIGSSEDWNFSVNVVYLELKIDQLCSNISPLFSPIMVHLFEVSDMSYLKYPQIIDNQCTLNVLQWKNWV